MLTICDAGRCAGGSWLWRGLSLAMQPGMRLGIAGPSGVGKTLLLRALAGLDALDQGTIWYQGVPLATLSMPAYRARVLYLSQTPALMEGTVEDNVRLPLRFRAHRGKLFNREEAQRWLERLGRDARFLQRSVDVLSGGERQIVAFLRALQLQPHVLLLDEPTANLDAEATRQVEALFMGWFEEHPERAAVWTSHQADQLDRMTDRCLDLRRYAGKDG